jgi:hypothetical protein
MVLLQVGNKIQLSQKRGRWAIFLLPILPIDEGALEFTEENLKLRAELGKLSAVYRDGEAVSALNIFFPVIHYAQAWHFVGRDKGVSRSRHGLRYCCSLGLPETLRLFRPTLKPSG